MAVIGNAITTCESNANLA